MAPSPAWPDCPVAGPCSAPACPLGAASGWRGGEGVPLPSSSDSGRATSCSLRSSSSKLAQLTLEQILEHLDNLRLNLTNTKQNCMHHRPPSLSCMALPWLRPALERVGVGAGEPNELLLLSLPLRPRSPSSLQFLARPRFCRPCSTCRQAVMRPTR